MSVNPPSPGKSCDALFSGLHLTSSQLHVLRVEVCGRAEAVAGYCTLPAQDESCCPQKPSSAGQKEITAEIHVTLQGPVGNFR